MSPQERSSPRQIARWSERTRVRVGLSIAVLGPVVLGVVLMPLRGSFADSSLPLVLVVPLVAAAVLAGRAGGVIAAVCTVACFDYFFTRPYFSLAIHTGEDVLTTTVLLFVGLAIAELVVRTHRSEQLADERGARVESMRRVAGMGSANEQPGWLIEAAGTELLEALDADEVVYCAGAPSSGISVLGHGRITVPSDAFAADASIRNGTRVGR